LSNAHQMLEQAHDYLVSCVKANSPASPVNSRSWAIDEKRLDVQIAPSIGGKTKPSIIGKSSEKFGELINILATVERLIDAIEWFQQQANFSNLSVRECHPSTSSTPGSCDLMLEDEYRNLLVLCEVSDIVAGGAKTKERSDLKNLGVKPKFPSPFRPPHLFLCVSPEMAIVCTAPRRKWHVKNYKYQQHPTNGPNRTVLLEII